MKERIFRKGLVFTILIVLLGTSILPLASSLSVEKTFSRKTSIALKKSNGPAPEINQNNLISTAGKANNLDNIGSHISSVRGTTMYAYNVNASNLTNGPCYFDTEDPGTVTKLSDETVTNFLSGGTWTYDENWLCCQYGTGVIYRVTADTGYIELIGGGGNNLNALAYNGETNTLWGAGDTNLFQIDMETGAQTVIAPFSGNGGSIIIGMAFDGTGTLYGWDVKFSGSSYLYKIDTATAECTQVGDFGVTLCYAQDGDFDRDNGNILYLTAFTIAPYYGGYLYAYDVCAGTCTLIGAFQGSAELDASMIQSCFCDYHDVGVKDIISPNNGYANQDMEVIVKIQNYGEHSEENVPVNVVILKDGVDEEYNKTKYVDIGYGETVDVEMPPWTPDDWHNTSNEYIDYKITAYTKLCGDDNSSNDFKEKWFELYFGYFHDAGCTNLSGPESGPAQTFTVNVTIKNFGQFDECCFKIYVEIAELDINGSPLLPPEYSDFTCVSEIDTGQEINLTFDDWTPAYLSEETSGTKMYLVKAWTDLNNPQDENPDNDLFEKTIELDFFHDVGIKEVTSPNIYIRLGNQNINANIENIGTFPEQDMTCYAEIYEYITNCTNGTLVYEDNITNIDIEQPLGGTETLTFDDYNFSAEGVYSLDLNLVNDNDDYPDNNQMTYVIGADGTPPVSNHSLDPATPDGENGWYVSDVEVTICAEDPSIGCDTDGSGVREIKYTVNGVQGSVPGNTGTFKIHNDGTNIEVKYWAVDNVGNTEAKHTFYINMDQTKPVVPENISYYAFKENRYWYVTLSVNCTDANSGMDRVEWAINDVVQNITTGPGPNYNWTIQWSDVVDPPTFKAIAYDKAGNSDFVTINGSDIKSHPRSQSVNTHLSSNMLFWEVLRIPILQKLLVWMVSGVV